MDKRMDTLASLIGISAARPTGIAGTIIEWLFPRPRVWTRASSLSTVIQERVMATLIYASNMSLDGCTEDERGAFDWTRPDDEVFVFITDLMRSAGTYLYGRRMYDAMAVWETEPALAAQSDLMREFANVWQAP